MKVVNEIATIKGLSYTQQAIFNAYGRAIMKDRHITWVDISKATGYTEKYLRTFAFTHYSSVPLTLALADVLGIDIGKIAEDFE